MPLQPRFIVIRLLMQILLLSLLPVTVLAYSPHKDLPEGWTGEWDLGGQFTRGTSSNTSFSASATVNYSRGAWESQLRTRLLRNHSKIAILRRDAQGAPLTDNKGLEQKDLVKQMTSNRRFVSFEPRYFFSSKHFLFSVLDHEVDVPGGIKYSSRQVLGVGYRLWRNKKDYATASVGIGSKQLRRTGESASSDGIGYVGFKYVRKLSTSVGLLAELDSDFGNDNQFTDLRVGLAWNIRDPLTLKLKFESLFDDDISAIGNPFAPDVRSIMTFNFGIKWK